MNQNTTTPDTDKQPPQGDMTAQPVYKLIIDDNVVEKISALSVQKVDGIIDMKGSLLSSIQEGLGSSSQTKGVTADVVDEENTRLEFNVILEYGKSAPQAFEQIKNVIAKDLKDMTGLGIVEMTVNVVDVMTREEYDQKRGRASDTED